MQIKIQIQVQMLSCWLTRETNALAHSLIPFVLTIHSFALELMTMDNWRSDAMDALEKGTRLWLTALSSAATTRHNELILQAPDRDHFQFVTQAHSICCAKSRTRIERSATQTANSIEGHPLSRQVRADSTAKRLTARLLLRQLVASAPPA